MSQLYARVFLQILDSSIAEDWQVRHVFEDMLKLQENGILDITREAFARRTNTPLEIINRAIFILESADPSSRDSDEGGRRIVRLDEHRDWGWRVVNWSKYEKLKTRADALDRVHRFRQKAHPSALPPAETETTPTPGMKRGVTQCNRGALQSGGGELFPDMPEFVDHTPHLLTEEQLRLNAIFRRRPETRWSIKEVKAWKQLTPIPEEDIQAIERYYGLPRGPAEKDYRRRDLCTLLNNWSGEVDRAKNYSRPSCL